MSGLTTALIINGIVLAAVLEADVGAHRKVGKLRIARPLLMAAGIIPLYLQALSTHGTGLGLELVGAAAGLLGGLIALSLTQVYRSPKSGQAVSRAGAGYAALWIVIIGARSAFSYGSEHWFSGPLGHWMTRHDVSVAALTDALILMAVAMVATRTIGLFLRARALPVANAHHRRADAAGSSLATIA
jgi:hypothetical protein